MVGSPKSSIYVTVTTEQGKKQHGLDQVWMVSVEQHKAGLLGLGHKDDEPVHYSATFSNGAYFVNSHPLAREPDLSGNILLAEAAKVSPDNVRDLLEQHLSSQGQTPNNPDHWIRQALVVFQSNGVIDNISVDDFMDFANTYARKRANHEAPAMIPYHKAVLDPHKKVKKHNFWVSYPMESSITPKESRIEGFTCCISTRSGYYLFTYWPYNAHIVEASQTPKMVLCGRPVDGQSYSLIVPTIQQRAVIFASHKHNYSDNPPEGWLGNRNYELFHNLARGPEGCVDFAALAGLGSKTATGGSSVEKVPLEIFYMVLQDRRLGERDIVAVGLCSRTLWCRVLSHISDRCRAPWAGLPLVCIGTWLSKLPKRVARISPHVLKRGPGQRYLREKVNMCCKTVNTNGERVFWVKLLEIWLNKEETPVGLRTDLYDGLEKALGTRENLGGRWILKNLDTREFVRLEVQHHPRGRMVVAVVEGHPWIGLDAALLYKITRAGGGVETDGRWAGHRFEIVPFRDPRMRTPGEWIDHTYAIAETCSFLCPRVDMTRVRFGPGWYHDGALYWRFDSGREDTTLQSLRTDHRWLTH